MWPRTQSRDNTLSQERDPWRANLAGQGMQVRSHLRPRGLMPAPPSMPKRARLQSAFQISAYPLWIEIHINLHIRRRGHIALGTDALSASGRSSAPHERKNHVRDSMAHAALRSN